MMRTSRFLMSVSLLLMLALSWAGIAAAQNEASARPWIGVSIADSDTGVVVRDIAPDSPAAATDLQVDDVIVSLNGEEVASSEALIEALQAFSPEDTVTLGILRGDESIDIEVTLGEFPEELQIVPDDRPNVQIFGRANMLPMLGVFFDEVDEGWQVTQVLPIPGATFEEGDIITAINGEPVTELDIRDLMGDLMQNEGTIEVTLLRDGEEMTLEIETVNMMGNVLVGDRVLLGVRYSPLDEAFSANLGIETSAGALITEVLPDTPAAAAELMSGDIVTAVNDTPIDSENDLSATISEFESGDTVTLTLLRAGEEITLEVTLEAQDVGRFGGFGPNGEGFEFRFDGEGRRGFGPDGRGFRFDGEGLEDFFEQFEGAIPAEGAFSVTCTNSTGDTVFSFAFSGTDGFDIENFRLPGDGGLDFENLDCDVTSGTDNVAPDAQSSNGDL